MPTLKDLIDQVKTSSANAYESVRDHVNGMRGGSATPEVNPNANPNVGPGRPSPEAQAYRAQPKGPFTEPVAPSNGSSLLRSGMRGLARGVIAPAAAYGGVYAAVDAARNGNTDQDWAAIEGTPAPGASLMSKETGDAYTHAVNPIRASMHGAVRRVGEAFGLGDAPVKTAQPIAGSTPPTEPSGLIPTLDNEMVTPGQLMAGNVRGAPSEVDVHTPASGYGAFQRTTKGDVGPATRVGARTGAVQPAAGGGLQLPEAKGLAGHMVNLAALGAQAHAAAIKESGMAREASLGIKAATAGVQIKKANQEIAAGANTALDKTVNDHIAGLIADKNDQYGIGGPRKGGTLGVGGESADQYKDRIGQQASETRNRIATTLANRRDGKNLEDLSDTETHQLLLLDRIRRKVDNGRGETVQNLRDLIGNKRFDSNDLYSYAPIAKMPSLVPGAGSFHFQLANGNTITATRAKGGEWNYVSPNGPVDSDVAAFFTKQIELQTKKGK